MAKGRALGRGLAALLPQGQLLEDIAGHVDSPRVQTLAIAEINSNPHQPRDRFDQQELTALAHSIKTHGLLQPILVEQDGNAYRLIAGERRLRASQLAGQTTVKAIVRHQKGNPLELALVENLLRSNLNPVEEATAFQHLIDRGLTQQQLAERLGRSRPSVANSLRLLGLDAKARQALATGQVTAGHARSLLTISQPQQRQRALRLLTERQLSVRDSERLAQLIQQDPRQNDEQLLLRLHQTAASPKSRNKPSPSQPTDLAELLQRSRQRGWQMEARDLSGKILHPENTDSHPADDKIAGEVVIHYQNSDELKRLLRALIRG